MTGKYFQIFAKPIGSVCNLNCRYCYYLKKAGLYPEEKSFVMPDNVLETYIHGLIEASPGSEIRFSWHGGEPTLLGVEFFKKVVSLQQKLTPPNKILTNNIQTNGIRIDDQWCEFLAEEKFTVGLSMDGPEAFHDAYRLTRDRAATHEKVMRAWDLLNRYHITTDILCVVHDQNVFHPLETYRFFKQIKARYLGFLPMVEYDPGKACGVSDQTVPAKAFGEFLCAVFDEWKREDIGKTVVQIFEEVARSALGQAHSLCIFRKTCGDFPVVEHNGDFYSCDHFVDRNHLIGNVMQTPLSGMLEHPDQRAFGRSKRNLLPKSCLKCNVLELCNGGCLKDRFIPAGDGKNRSYLCDGYKLFFNHCMPFVKALAAQHRRNRLEKKNPALAADRKKIGRNDPCLCGSGKKNKNCCRNGSL